MPDRDVVIVGGGHNGLVVGGYLAKSGLDVLVLERQERLGGPAGRREFLPGYRSSVTNSPGGLEPKVVQDLELERHGLEFVRPDPTLVQPMERGTLFVGHRNRIETAKQLDGYASGEAARYDALFGYLQDFADRLGISVFREPPTLQELLRNCSSTEDEEAFSRIMFGAGIDLARYFLQSAEAQTIVAMLCTASGPPSAQMPGSAFNLMMRPLSLASGQTEVQSGTLDPRQMVLRGSTGLPVNGMGSIIEAMHSFLRSHGGKTRVGVEVDRVVRQSNGELAVVTTAGEEISARIVVSATGPRRTIEHFFRDTPEWEQFQGRLTPNAFHTGACKVVLATEGLPSWVGGPEHVDAQALAAAQFRVCPSVDYLENAYAECVLGRMPARPVIWGLIPSVTSPDLAPPGHHVLSLNVSAPRHLRNSNWTDGRKAAIDNTVAALTEWMPDLPGRIVGSTCVTPDEFEEEYGLEDAQICHSPPMPGNEFWMRPLPGLHRYRTPTPGMYLSGNGTWPGNNVSGLSGHNTARAIFNDLRAEKIG